MHPFNSTYSIWHSFEHYAFTQECYWQEKNRNPEPEVLLNSFDFQYVGTISEVPYSSPIYINLLNPIQS